MSLKKVLLTGGSGFIGKNILESYLAQKYQILAPNRTELDLLDTKSTDEYFNQNSFDVVIHSAAKPGHRNSPDSSNLLYSNLRMFSNLERNKEKFGKLINIGSGAIYDNSKDIVDVNENEIYKNIGEEEHSFCKYIMQKQIDKIDSFVSLNIFGIFGKYEDWEIRFISNAICKSIFDLPITIKQNRRFSYLFVEDLMPILEFFIENNPKHKSYNIVPDAKFELVEIANMIRQFSDSSLPLKISKDGMGLEYTGDNSLLKSEFVNLKFTNIFTAIKMLYNFYNKNKDTIDKKLLLIDK